MSIFEKIFGGKKYPEASVQQAPEVPETTPVAPTEITPIIAPEATAERQTGSVQDPALAAIGEAADKLGSLADAEAAKKGSLDIPTASAFETAQPTLEEIAANSGIAPETEAPSAEDASFQIPESAPTELAPAEVTIDPQFDQTAAPESDAMWKELDPNGATLPAPAEAAPAQAEVPAPATEVQK